MGLTPRITWWQNKQLYLMSDAQTKAHPCESMGKTAARKTILALPGDVFIRRTHPRPFQKKRSLARILPGFLQDTLFEQDRESCQTVFTSTGLETKKFTSFSVRKDTLQDFVEKTAARTTYVVHAAPSPAGLAWFAPENKNAIIIAPTPEGITATAVDTQRHVLDFRTITAEKWQKEARLTLNGWLDALPQAGIYVIGNVSIPDGLKAIPIKPPAHIPAEQACAYGLLQLVNAGKLKLSPLKVKDPNANVHLNLFAAKLRPALILFTIATLIAYGNVALQKYKMSSQQAQLEAQTTLLFEQALPGVPMVDAPLQLSRRHNELSLAAGQALANVSPLPEKIAQLQEKTAQAGIPLTLSELVISQRTLRLRGQLPELAMVDLLQETLKGILPNATLTLHNAQLNETGKVEFHLEAKHAK